MNVTTARKAFGVRLRVARIYAGKMQVDLASDLGVPQQSVSNWERGRNLPSGDGTVRIASVLHVRAEWLASGTGDMR